MTYFDNTFVGALVNASGVTLPSDAGFVDDQNVLAEGANVTLDDIVQVLRNLTASLSPLQPRKPNRIALALFIEIGWIKGKIGGTKPQAGAVPAGYIYMDTANNDAMSWSDNAQWHAVGASDRLLDVALIALRNEVSGKVSIETVNAIKGNVDGSRDTLEEIGILIDAINTSLTGKLNTDSLQTELIGKSIRQQDVSGLTGALGDKIDVSSKGANSGVAPLDANARVPSANLPAFVDDVQEFTDLASFPSTGTGGIIYVALDTGKIYRWSGSAYIEIVSSPGSTDEVSEGSSNLYFTNARAVSAVTPANIGAATAAQGALADTAVQPGEAIENISKKDTYAAARAGQDYVDGAVVLIENPGGGVSRFIVNAASAASDDGHSILVTDSPNVVRLIRQADDGIVRPEWFGSIDLSGATSSNTALQALVTACNADSTIHSVRMRNGIYQTTAPLVFNRAINIRGEQMPSPKTDGEGTWFHFNHSGKGIQLAETVATQTLGSRLADFGTKRTQPTPGASWTPTVFDWDIYADQSGGGDHYFENIFLLNAYKGIIASGRSTCRNIRGQVFHTAIEMPFNADVSRVLNCHFWPYWSAQADVQSYQLDNSDGLVLGRFDNGVIDDLFTFGMRSGIRIITDARGSTVRTRGENLEFDSCKHGIWIEADNVSLHIGKLQSQCDYQLIGGIPLFITGDNCELVANDVRLSGSQLNSIRVDGTGNVLDLTHANLRDWDLSESGFPAVDCAAGNEITFGRMPRYSQTVRGTAVAGGAGSFTASGNFFGGAGDIILPHRSGRFTGNTDGAGLKTIAHGYGKTPTGVQITMVEPAATDWYFKPLLAMDATNFSVQLRDGNDANVAANGVTFDWTVFS